VQRAAQSGSAASGARTALRGEVVLAAVVERRGKAERQVANARRGERQAVQRLDGAGAEVEHEREPVEVVTLAEPDARVHRHQHGAKGEP
jgi:hypothetical protein